MADVTLSIVNPQHGMRFFGSAASTIDLNGSIDHPDPGTLFYKWYSSLYNPDIETSEDAPKAALNWPDHAYQLDPLNVSPTFAVGSHTLTLTAKNIEGDSLNELQAVTEAGMTGGPPTDGANPNPCIIHVFVATIVMPDDVAPPLLFYKDTTIALEAQAPLKWAESDYQSINRIRFRWRFVPEAGGDAYGLPPLDASDAEIEAFQQDLEFHYDDERKLAFVRYSGGLPNAIPVGNYTLYLRVEDKQTQHDGDEDTVAVRIDETAP